MSRRSGPGSPSAHTTKQELGVCRTLQNASDRLWSRACASGRRSDRPAPGRPPRPGSSCWSSARPGRAPRDSGRGGTRSRRPRAPRRPVWPANHHNPPARRCAARRCRRGSARALRVAGREGMARMAILKDMLAAGRVAGKLRRQQDEERNRPRTAPDGAPPGSAFRRCPAPSCGRPRSGRPRRGRLRTDGAAHRRRPLLARPPCARTRAPSRSRLCNLQLRYPCRKGPVDATQRT